MSHGPTTRDGLVGGETVVSSPERSRSLSRPMALAATGLIAMLIVTAAPAPVGSGVAGALSITMAGDDDDDEEKDDEAEETTTTIDRAAVAADRQAAAEEACAAAVSAPLDLPITPEMAADLTWKRRFGQVGTKEAFIDQIGRCTGPQRAARVEQECTDEPDVQVLARDPDRLLGECFTLTVLVIQFDAATGPCGFRGAYDTVAHEFFFDYVGDNGLFVADEPCPFLDGVYNDSVVEMRLVGNGATSYETTLGAELTAPAFTVLGLE